MKHNEEIHDEIGDNHYSTNPLREDALILLMTKNRKYKKRCRKYPSYTWDGFDR
jgi:hypothetical protein